MPIYTKTTYISPMHPIPSEEDIARGISKDYFIANHTVDAVAKGYTTTVIRLELEPEENGTQRFNIFQEWADAEQAQIYADLVVRILTSKPEMVDGFAGCVVITE